ncbi:MAG: SpoIIE family protein phosphatase [Verrucomicrobia bacterium]|nr:SpoIIE family protein phosphatase [Verrucomicrobiota bacterium]
MSQPLRVLIVEDSEFDARVLVNLLKRGGYDPAHQRVETADQFRAALAAEPWQIILSDYNLPTFSAPDALRLLQESGRDIPFIVISGGIGEDIAVAMMKGGASDYLMKGNLARLVPAVERELREAEVRAARRQAEQGLRESEQRYRGLWETAADAVLLMDDELRVTFANPAVERIFGRPLASVVGQSLASLQLRFLPPNDSLHVTPGSIGALAHEMRIGIEASAPKPNGGEIIVGAAFNEMEMQGRRWVVVFLRDLTQKKRDEAELRKKREQFEVAREIQRRLFPKEAPQLPGFDFAGVSLPADEAGGDYFDFLPMPSGKLAVVVGDVAGHGVGPALLMAEARAYLHLLVLSRDDVGVILTRANLALSADVDFEHYITLLMAQFDPAARTLQYASAGHTGAYVLGADGTLRAELKRTGIALGLRAQNEYHTAPPLELQAGDVVLLLSDGVEEAANPEGELFGAERAFEIVRHHAARPAAEILRALTDAVIAFSQGQPQLDDVTVVVAKVLARA